MIQLVVSGNRIVAHGEDCFLAMGGTVVCTATGRVFQNSTVVNHDGAIPCDLDQVGYEYHAGEFVPCAPFGVGTGNILVACDDCKTIKDSGISAKYLPNVMNTGLTLSYLPTISMPNNGYTKIMHENGLLVAMNAYSVAYSKDGETWETQELPFNDAQDITYGNGIYLVTGQYAVAYSTDLITWTSVKRYGLNVKWESVAYGNGRFVAVGCRTDVPEGAKSSYSEDGVNWSALSDVYLNGARRISYGNGKFVVINKGINYSGDGITWNDGGATNFSTADVTSLRFLNGVFVAIHVDGVIKYTADPTQPWTDWGSLNGSDWCDIDFKDGVYVAVSKNSRCAQATAIDREWAEFDVSVSRLAAVANNGKQFVAVGGSTALTSEDGENWSIRGEYRFRLPNMVDVTDTVKSVLGL